MSVSVILPCFNQEHCIGDAIESLLRQTFTDWEAVIVDDASTDGSRELLQAWQNRHPDRIRLLLLESNGGVARARCAALAECRGQWVTELDGDDVYLPTKLEQERALALTHGGDVVAFSNYVWVDADGHTLGQWWDGQEKSMPEGSLLAALFGCDFPRGSLPKYPLVPRSLIPEPYNESSLRVYEDLDLHLRVAAEAPWYFCPMPAFHYVRHGQGLSSANAAVYFESLRWIWNYRRSVLEKLSEPQRRMSGRKFKRWIGDMAMIRAVELKDRGKPFQALVWWTRMILWKRRLEHLSFPFGLVTR